MSGFICADTPVAGCIRDDVHTFIQPCSVAVNQCDLTWNGRTVRVKIFIICVLVMITNTVYSQSEPGGSANLVAAKTETAPVIDGNDLDACWANAQAITTHDTVADIDITLKALHTDEHVFFLVSFPDPDESRTHKSWAWDKSMELYKMGPDREDGFVFKWNMESESVDLSLRADKPYRADTWFWKACRTDPAGFVDDKIQILSFLKVEKSLMLTSKSGATMYLLRQGDKGTAAFKTKMTSEYEGDMVNRFVYQQPTGSRADVKAKGIWENGRWTIEFARSLVTGHDDDVQFDLTGNYEFGVSRYEIKGGKPDKKVSQPLYECGDTNEIITLVFEK